MPRKKKNPVDEYLLDKEAQRQKKRQDSLDFVQRFQQADREGQLDESLKQELYQRFAPVMHGAIKKYRGPLAGPGLETKARSLVAQGIRTYDPNAGTVPETHVTNYLKRLWRENLQQDSVRHTEADAGLIGPMDRARDELVDELGRDPTPQEQLQRMNEFMPAHRRVDQNRFNQIQQRRGGTVLSSSFESNPEEPAQMQHQLALQNQRMDLLEYDLKPRQRDIYNRILGRQGFKPTTSTGELARQIGVSAPTISRERKAIARQLGIPEQQLGVRQRRKK